MKKISNKIILGSFIIVVFAIASYILFFKPSYRKQPPFNREEGFYISTEFTRCSTNTSTSVNEIAIQKKLNEINKDLNIQVLSDHNGLLLQVNNLDNWKTLGKEKKELLERVGNTIIPQNADQYQVKLITCPKDKQDMAINYDIVGYIMKKDGSISVYYDWKSIF